MILLNIDDNWYFFLIFVGGIAFITGIVLFKESRNRDDKVLQQNPLIILRNIVINQIGFYLLYLLVAFTVDVAGFENFWWTQVFTAVEFSFYTKRGLMTAFAMILTFAATSIPVTASVQTYRNMLDYCFTVFVIHFIVVSIAAGDFPANGAWWVAIFVSLILFMILSERFSYHLETMSYQSSLEGPKYGSKKSSKDSVNLSSIDSKDNIPERELKDKEESRFEENVKGDSLRSKESRSSKSSKDSKTSKGESANEATSDDGETKKSSLRKHKSVEEAGLKHSDNSEEGQTLEGAKKKRNTKTKQLTGSKTKSLPLKEEGGNGKKDSLRNAKQRAQQGEGRTSMEAVELDDVKKKEHQSSSSSSDEDEEEEE